MLRRIEPFRSKATATVYLILRGLVLLTLIRGLFRREYETVFLCVMTLILLDLPSVLARRLKIVLPSAMEIVALLFIFSAEILGEINSFYMRVPHWDTTLHTINGFCCAAVGFSLVDTMNRSERFSLRLSPLFLAVVSFCFSMTVGVLWEFFEFSGDRLFLLDMQKDTVIRAFGTVAPDASLNTVLTRFKDISDVILVLSDGSQVPLGLGGYLDIGLLDTMKDLFVNFLGALVFSVIGFFYASGKDKRHIAERFVPRVEEDEAAGK